MKARLIRIGNSRGVRIPREMLRLYNLAEGDEIELQERQNGILLHPVSGEAEALSYTEAYREMAEEVAEAAEWTQWDESAGDGLSD